MSFTEVRMVRWHRKGFSKGRKLVRRRRRERSKVYSFSLTPSPLHLPPSPCIITDVERVMEEGVMHRIIKAKEAKVGMKYYTIRGRPVRVIEVEMRGGQPFRAVVESEEGDRFLLPPDYPLREIVTTDSVALQKEPSKEEGVKKEGVRLKGARSERRSLSSLSPDFIRLVLEGRSNAEIAELLNKDRDVVSSRRGNLRAKLRREGKTLQELARELGVIEDEQD